ncbi:MAG: hypothetical protein GY754_14565 [bacterium]|nr:hypothetical protein [bacterium]
MKKNNYSIEALMLMAKYDPGFKEQLLQNREAALAEAGIDLTSGERLLLTNISTEQLRQNINEFRVEGITEKSLPSWKAAASVMLLLSTLMFACDGSTSSGLTKGITAPMDTKYHGGWADSNTYRSPGHGSPKEGLKNEEERKQSARQAAIQIARKHIYLRFKNPRPITRGIVNTDVKGSFLSKEIRDAIEQGKIIHEYFDEQGNCSLMYEIQLNELRKKMEKK